MFHMLDADSPASRLQTEPPLNCNKLNGVGDERVGRDPRQRLFEVFGLVTGGLWCPFGAQLGVRLDLRRGFVVGECEHAAMVVVDENDLAGAKQTQAYDLRSVVQPQPSRRYWS